MPEEILALKKVKSRAGNVIYGAILTLSLLVALDQDTSSLLRTAVIVLVTLISVWAAKSYAYIIGWDVALESRAEFSEKMRVFKETMWVLTPGIPIFVLLIPAATDIISVNTALSLAQWIIVLFLFVTGFWLRRKAGGSFFNGLIDGFIDCSVGILIVALRVLVK
jgi:hypothetical protein